MAYVFQSCFIQDQFTEAVTDTSVEVLPENALRKYLAIFNRGTASIYLKYTTAHSSTEGIIIGAKALFEPLYVPCNAVFLKASTGSQDIFIMWG